MLACSQEKGLLTIFPQTFSACASQVSPSSPLTGAQQLLRETDNVPFTQIELCHGESRFHLSNYRYLNETIKLEKTGNLRKPLRPGNRPTSPLPYTWALRRWQPQFRHCMYMCGVRGKRIQVLVAKNRKGNLTSSFNPRGFTIALTVCSPFCSTTNHRPPW